MAEKEYIEREKAIKPICDACNKQFPEEPCEPSDCTIMQALRSIPAADVRPARWGRWIPDYDCTEYDYDGSTPLPEPLKFQDGWQCSLCGWYMPNETNYCPNCGADMRPEPPKEE